MFLAIVILSSLILLFSKDDEKSIRDCKCRFFYCYGSRYENVSQFIREYKKILDKLSKEDIQTFHKK